MLTRERAEGGTSPRKLLATPRVLATARRHYNCSCATSTDVATDEGGGLGEGGCLDGIPLEDCRGSADCGEGEGTAGSHWEQRVMRGDVMVGTAGAGHRPVVSDLTLSVFADAGWYLPNMDVPAPRCFYDPRWCDGAGGEAGGGEAGGEAGGAAATADGAGTRREPFLWGRGRGCAFVTEGCDGAAWRSAPGYWCAADPSDARVDTAAQRARIDAEGCTLGRLAVGRCTLREHASPVPPPYRYFGDSLPSLGGNAMEDYCPITEAYLDWDCRAPPRTAAAADAARTKGEARCDQCRCFASSLYNSSRLQASPYHGCYPHRCLSGQRLQVYVDGAWRECTDELTVPGWSGALTCPPAEELCATAEERRWPAIATVHPARGPAAGGTTLTISGVWLYDAALASMQSAERRLDGRSEAPRQEMGQAGAARRLQADSGSGDDGSGATDGDGGEGEEGGEGDGGALARGLPRVLVCGMDALEVRIAPSSPRDDASNASSSASPLGEMQSPLGEMQRLVVTTPALPPSPADASGGAPLNVSCHVSLLTVDGREALATNAFRYEREPVACTALGQLDQFEWQMPQLVSLYVCLWPSILSALAVLWTLHGGWRVRRRLAPVRRVEAALHDLARREVAPARISGF